MEKFVISSYFLKKVLAIEHMFDYNNTAPFTEQ